MSIKSLLSDFKKIESVSLEPRWVVLIMSENVQEIKFRIKSLQNELERQNFNRSQLEKSVYLTEDYTVHNDKNEKLFIENQRLDLIDSDLLLTNIRSEIKDLEHELSVYTQLVQLIVNTNPGSLYRGWLKANYAKLT